MAITGCFGEVVGSIHRIFKSEDINHHETLIEGWKQWASEATPTENRTEAVKALIHCLRKNNKVLSLSYLGLTSLPAQLPPSVKCLLVLNNELRELPAPLPRNLEELYAGNNKLASLPDTLPAELNVFSVYNNQLKTLPSQLPATLQTMVVAGNQIEQLPLLPESLLCLNANDNRLVALPTQLPPCLEVLCVEGNELRTLPEVLPPSLRKFEFRANPLEDFLATIQERDSSLKRFFTYIVDDIQSSIAYFTPQVQQWEPICYEAHINHFISFIEKLKSGSNNQNSPILKKRVGDWLDYLAREENKALRANTFLIAQEASTSCVDRASFYFNKMYLLMREDQLIKTDTPVVESFNTNLGLFRLQQLEKIAAEKATVRRALSGGFAEELEIYLAYECLLREELSLPIYSELQFSAIAGLTQDDLTRAKNEIEQQEKAGFIGYLINESASWQARLTQWDRLQVESVEETYLDFIGSDDFNQQVNQKLVEDKIDIHDTDAYRTVSTEIAEKRLYQQRYQLTRKFLAAQGDLALLDDFNLKYRPIDE